MGRSRNLLLAAVAVAIAFVGVVPADADAGRARVSSGRVVYDAQPGEANDLKVTLTSRTTVTVTDRGAPVTPGTRCARVNDQTASCTIRPGFAGFARLGDGDDRAESSLIALNGEAGNDTLTQTARAPVGGIVPGNSAVEAALVNGGAGTDTIVANDANGGEGNDTLTPSQPGSPAALFGGPGNDEVRGSTRDDVLGGGLGVDRIASAGGEDTLSFQDQPGPVVFSVFTTTGDQPDVYEGSFISVIGASAADRLTGDGRDNELRLGPGEADGGLLEGSEGQDTLIGAGGRERIGGGTGDDRLFDGDLNGQISELEGGEGNDSLTVADIAEEDSATSELELAPTADVFACGPGLDRAIVDVQDAVPGDCEVVSLRGPLRTTTTGTAEANVIDGFSGDGDEDTIRGRGGDDRLRGLNGDDTILGEDGNDRISGDGATRFRADGRDRLYGGNGNDLLQGVGGRDYLKGGPGADDLQGGSGDDSLNARDGRRDRVKCGSGRDRVAADRGDVVARDCERVGRS